jgi:hypothetical protein
MRKFGGLAGATSQPPTNAPHGARFSSLLGPHVAAWVQTCADYYAAAALYEQLYRRSDPELRQLGLSREHLGQELCAAAIEPHTQVRSRGQKMVSKALGAGWHCYVAAIAGPIRSACGTGPP